MTTKANKTNVYTYEVECTHIHTMAKSMETTTTKK